MASFFTSYFSTFWIYFIFNFVGALFKNYSWKDKTENKKNIKRENFKNLKLDQFYRNKPVDQRTKRKKSGQRTQPKLYRQNGPHLLNAIVHQKYAEFELSKAYRFQNWRELNLKTKERGKEKETWRCLCRNHHGLSTTAKPTSSKARKNLDKRMHVMGSYTELNNFLVNQ